MSFIPKGTTIHIREVWADNLEREFQLIREIVDDYPCLAMETRLLVTAAGNFNNTADHHYQTLRANLDLLKVIQLGLTFSDEDGNLPQCGTPDYCIWQFNFRELNPEDIQENYSTNLSQQSGINFQANLERGIDFQTFGELLMTSGIVLNENVQWVTFQSSYNFGYLLKLLTGQNLPSHEPEFFHLLRTYFPIVYDANWLIKVFNSLHSGLNPLAQILEVGRIGPCHQAGSDSLLTSCTFRKLKELFLNGSRHSREEYAHVLYGLRLDNRQAWVWIISPDSLLTSGYLSNF